MTSTQTELTVTEFKRVLEAIENNSYSDGETFVIGELIEIKPIYVYGENDSRTLVGIDIYRYADFSDLTDEELEDYDYDADFIKSIYL